MKRKLSEIVRAKAVEYLMKDKPENYHVNIDREIIEDTLG